MNPVTGIFSDAVLRALGETLLHSAWQFLLVAGVLWLLLLLSPRQAAVLRYRLGMAALAAMILLPVLTFWLVYTPQTQAAAAPAAIFLAAGAVLSPDLAAPGWQETVLTWVHDHAAWLVGGWALGALILAIRLLGGWVLVQRLRTQADTMLPAHLQGMVERLAQRLELRRRVRVGISRSLHVPAAAGLLRPMILIPASLLTQMRPEQIELLLLHELAHIRRRDYLANLFQSLAEIVLFYHPCVWWVSALVREERENCCDEWVVRAAGEQTLYARTLLELEEMRRVPVPAVAATGGPLFRRILRILGQPGTQNRRGQGWIVLGLGTALAALLVLIQLSPLHAAGGEPDSLTTAAPAPVTAPARKPLLSPDMQAALAALDIPGLDVNGAQFDPAALLSQLPFLSFATAAADSPGKRILVENGKRVEYDLDSKGRTTRITVDGRELRPEEWEPYLDLQEARAASPLAPLPPMPPLDLSGMPAFPEGFAEAMRKMAEQGENFDAEAFEKMMEQYGKDMEAWGRKLEQSMAEGGWEAWGQQMEAWGEQFGGQMEAWAETHAADLERMSEELERSMEGLSEVDAAEIEAEIERIQEEAAESREDAADAREDAAEMRREAEERRVEARERAEEAREEAERIREEIRNTEEAADREASRNADILREQVVRDGYARNGERIRLHISDKEVEVNGRRLPDADARRYRKLCRDLYNLREIGDLYINVK